MYDLRDILTTLDVAEARTLLQSQGLELPGEVEYGVGVHSSGKLVGTGFLGKGRLMGLCVDPALRGEGLSTLVVDHLLKEALSRGYEHLFIFTKGSEAYTFAGMGFTLLTVAPAPTGDTALLEWGRPDLEEWLSALPRPCLPEMPSSAAPALYDVGAVVLNANPFTLGHRYLLSQALKKCRLLYAFVVEEDRSVFPFDVRLDLVRQGMAHEPRCLVLPGGPYMVSRHTFPSYFTGEEGRAAAHASLDAHLFASRIAPALHISARFVGSEPYSAVTALYNSSLQTVLPRYTISLTELPRMERENMAVSASRVRALLSRGEVEKALELTPPSTTNFLLSPDGQAVVQRLQQSEDILCPQSKE